MKPPYIASILLPALLSSAASAQLLAQGNGNLPACGRSCSVLTQAQQTCNGGSSASLSAWSCFCEAVWTNSNGALTTMCATSCANPNDNTLIQTWYTNNCGSDNGASEHGGGNTGGTGTNGGASSSGVPSSAPSGATTSGSFSSSDNQICVGWWNCHWKWVVMIIVVALGLLILGFGGRWLKKRHERKQDRMSESFNAGITSRGPPMSNNDVHDSHVSGPADIDAASGRNSPSRTRDAFMPYGYGYARSESRLDRSSPLARGATPMNELEKGADSQTPAPPPKKKSRRIMVRERSAEGEGQESEKR